MKNFKKVFAVLAACTMAAGMISVAACTPEEPGPGPDGPGNGNPARCNRSPHSPYGHPGHIHTGEG